MDKTYSVITVGSGNGALASSALLSQNGYRVLLLERNGVPGGSATSFVRGRFEFEASLHELANVGTEEKPGNIRKFFSSLGTNVEWVELDDAFRVIYSAPDGFDATLPVGLEAFLSKIEELVPGSRESVGAFLSLADRVDEALLYMGKGNADPSVLIKEHSDFLSAASHSIDECLDALNVPKKAQNILKTYWPYLGANPSVMDAAHYLMMIIRYIRGGAVIVKGTSHSLSLALEEVIRKNGGDVRYNTEVDKILVKDKKAYGVSIHGEEIYSDYVITSAFPDKVYSSMIEKSEVPPEALSLSSKRKHGKEFVVVYLGLSKSPEALGIKDYTVFLYPSFSFDGLCTSLCAEDKIFLIANCPNVVDKSASEEGTSILILTTMFEEGVWGEVKVEDYAEAKNKITDKLIELYEKRTGVKVRDSIEEIETATPVTFARYLNTPGGTPYGYSSRAWDTIIPRIMSAGNENWIKNLYFAGAHQERSLGYSSTYANGIDRAKRIMKEAGKNG